MKTLVVSALILGMSVGNLTDKKPTPKAPVESFSHKYFVQVDKANAALREYLNTPCNVVDEHQKAGEAFVKEANLLEGMYKNIPLAEDDVTKAHEVEVLLGFNILAKDGIDIKSNECKDTTGPSVVPSNVL